MTEETPPLLATLGERDQLLLEVVVDLAMWEAFARQALLPRYDEMYRQLGWGDPEQEILRRRLQEGLEDTMRTLGRVRDRLGLEVRLTVVPPG